MTSWYRETNAQEKIQKNAEYFPAVLQSIYDVFGVETGLSWRYFSPIDTDNSYKAEGRNALVYLTKTENGHELSLAISKGKTVIGIKQSAGKNQTLTEISIVNQKSEESLRMKFDYQHAYGVIVTTDVVFKRGINVIGQEEYPQTVKSLNNGACPPDTLFGRLVGVWRYF